MNDALLLLAVLAGLLSAALAAGYVGYEIGKIKQWGDCETHRELDDDDIDFWIDHGRALERLLTLQARTEDAVNSMMNQEEGPTNE